MNEPGTSSANPFLEISEKTNEAFANLQEGQIFTEKFEFFAIIAIVKKNLVVIYQGTQMDLRPICYQGRDIVVKKFQMAQQSGYSMTYLKTDKQFSDKLLNE